MVLFGSTLLINLFVAISARNSKNQWQKRGKTALNHCCVKSFNGDLFADKINANKNHLRRDLNLGCSIK